MPEPPPLTNAHLKAMWAMLAFAQSAVGATGREIVRKAEEGVAIIEMGGRLEEGR